MTRTLSSFDIKALSTELEQTLTGKRIDNVYQPQPELFIIRLRPNGSDLLIEVGKRVHLTKYQYPVPSQPSSICMAFRKRMKGSKIDRVYQLGFERILIFDLQRSDSERYLIAEFFQKGNLILADGSWKIELPLRRLVSKDRRIARAEDYKVPPASPSDPFSITLEGLQKIRELGRIAVVRALTKHLGIGGTYSEAILSKAGIQKDIECEKLSPGDVSAIYTAVKDLIRPFLEGTLSPSVVVEGEEPIDVTPVRLPSHGNLVLLPRESFNSALDEFYAQGYTGGPASQELQRKLEEAQRILAFQRDKLTELRTQREQTKRIGDLIYAHYDDLSKALHGEVDNSPTRVDPASKTASVELEGLKFSLKTDEELLHQAARFYKESKKIQSKIDGLLVAIEETKSKLKPLAQESEAQREVRLKERTPKKWYEKFRWFRSSHGLLMLSGKDASNNEQLLKKYTEKDDLVLHSDIQGASFVVIKSEGQQIDDETIKEAAQIAASYSKAWSQGLGTIDVSVMKPEQLSKTPPSGHFLSKGAFSVEGPRKLLRAVQLVVAIGLSTSDGVEVIGGPPSSVQVRTNNYVEVVPGRLSSLELSKIVAGKLLSKAKGVSGMKLTKPLLSEVQRFIPSGRGELKG